MEKLFCHTSFPVILYRNIFISIISKSNQFDKKSKTIIITIEYKNIMCIIMNYFDKKEKEKKEVNKFLISCLDAKDNLKKVKNRNEIEIISK